MSSLKTCNLCLILCLFLVMVTADTLAREYDYHVPVTNSIEQYVDLADNFSFVVIGHVRGDASLTLNPFFEKAMEVIASTKPDFIILTGDLTWGDWSNFLSKKRIYSKVENDWQMFKEFMNKFKIHYYTLPGNHEVNDFQTKRIYNDTFGVPFGATIIKDYNFVFLDTTSFGTPDTHGLNLDQEKLLYSFKSQEERDRTFVFMHHPIWRKIQHLSQPIKVPMRYCFAGNWVGHVYSKDNDGVKVLSGLCNPKWCGDKSTPRKYPINFTKVLIEKDKVRLFRIVVDIETEEVEEIQLK